MWIHLSYFCLLAIVNNAAISISVKMCFEFLLLIVFFLIYYYFLKYLFTWLSQVLVVACEI